MLPSLKLFKLQLTNLLIGFLVASLLVSTKNGRAQAVASGQQSPQLVYRNWNNQNGLPQNTISDVVKDRKGYLWVATEEGLVKFDGAEFLLYNESKIPGLHSSNFTDLSVAGHSLWAASRNTILHFERNKVNAIDFRKYLTNAWIKCVEADSSGRLWIGTSAGAIYYLEKDSIYKWQDEIRDGASSIEVLRAHPNGLLIGTAKGLYQIDKSGRGIVAFPSFKDKYITAITVGKRNEVWVGTAENGLFLSKDDKVVLHLSEEQGLKEPYINSLALGERGAVWIGTRSSGFQVFENGRISSPDQNKYGHDGIRAILNTDGKITWLGTNASGLVQIKPAQIQMFKADKELAESIILPIYQHPGGEVWIGTAGKGVNRLWNGRKTTFTKENGLSNNLVLAIAGTEDYIFIGTSSGLNRFNPRTGKIDRHFTKADGLVSNSVQALFYDSKKRLWLATRAGGIQILKDGNTVETLPIPTDLLNTSFLNIFEDRSGNIWLGSRGGGMACLDSNNQFLHFSQKNGFNADIVFSFWEDATGRLWMATDKGLYGHYNGQFKLFDKSAGLKFNEIYQVLEDTKGYLWLSGNFGLQRVSLAELQRYPFGQNSEVSLSVRLFNAIDGMSNAETNGGFSQAGWKMKDGNLWFPTVQGIAIVNPAFISDNTTPLSINLQNFKYGDKESGSSQKITVPPNVNAIEIAYTSIDFSKADDITYYYRLKGLNNDWKAVGNRRVVYFTGLTHGTYTFEVKAEQYGQWSPAASLTFTIAPYFYQSTGFKIAILVLCLVIVSLLILIQKRKEQQKLLVAKNITKAQIIGQEKERQVIGEELHDSINQQLATVKLYLDFARTSEEARMAMIERSEKVVHHVIDEIRALCKRLTPPTLKDIGLTEALQELIDSYTVVEKFAVHYTCSASLDELEEGVQFSIFRMVQEVLQNIDKHAQAKNVWINIGNKKDLITIMVKDDGCGFDVKAKPKGTGFFNIKNRLELYNGYMDIETAAGAGCTIFITLPLNTVDYLLPGL